MPGWLFPLVLAIHAMAAIFWAGSTFVLARTGGVGGEALMRPQLGAATFAIITGALLFWMGHSAGFGPMETVLVVGAIAALGAAIAQGWMRAVATHRRAAAGHCHHRHGDSAVLDVAILTATNTDCTNATTSLLPGKTALALKQ